MPKDLTPADPTAVLELLSAFRKSQIMFTAVQLGVFDTLAKGSRTPAALASELKLDEDATVRLLGACDMLGLVRRNHGSYENTPAANAYLTGGSDERMLGYVGYSNVVLWKMWDHLPDAIREGTHRWKQTYGSDGPIFSHFYRTDEARREFLMGMHGYGRISSPQVVNAVDLSKFNTFVDLGGATGHLALAACKRWSNLNGVVFDLPEVLKITAEFVDPERDRVTMVGGDFFADPLPKGDVYALSRILHDWTEEKIIKLLQRIYDALPAGGAVFIGEKVLHDDKAGPEWAVLQSLNMLVCTEGKERTVGEYEALLTKIGFTNVTVYRTPSPLDVVFAVKP
jgi:acetylserotonin N-methyltransferase